VQRTRLSLAAPVQQAVLREQVAQARARLSLARGVRALEEAELARRQGNTAAALQRLLAARSQLEGLPVDQVRDRLASVTQLQRQLRGTPAPPCGRPVIQALAVRDELEQLHDLAALGELRPMARRASRLAEQALDLPPPVSAWQPPVADYASAAEELTAAVLSEELALAAALEMHNGPLAAQRRAAVAAALDELDLWQHTAWWNDLAARAKQP